jgi:hypothetical protein
MNWGAFAGGITKGAETGSNIVNTTRRTKAMEDEILLRKEAGARAEKELGFKEEEQAWKRRDREREDLFNTDLKAAATRANADLVDENGNPVPLNPLSGDPKHQQKWNQLQTDMLLARVNHNRMKPEELTQFNAVAKAMKDEKARQAYSAALTTGDTSGLTTILGMQPGSLKVERGRDGGFNFKTADGSTLPSYYIDAAITGTSPVAAMREHEKHVSGLSRDQAAIGASNASAAASRAHAATAGASTPAGRLAQVEAYAQKNGLTVEEAAKKMRDMGIFPQTASEAADSRSQPKKLSRAQIRIQLTKDPTAAMKYRRDPKSLDADIEDTYQSQFDAPEGDAPKPKPAAAAAPKPVAVEELDPASLRELSTSMKPGDTKKIKLEDGRVVTVKKGVRGSMTVVQ